MKKIVLITIFFIQFIKVLAVEANLQEVIKGLNNP